MDKILAENIQYGVAKKEILKDVTINLKKDNFVGIIGPNGSVLRLCLRMTYFQISL